MEYSAWPEQRAEPAPPQIESGAPQADGAAPPPPSYHPSPRPARPERSSAWRRIFGLGRQQRSGRGQAPHPPPGAYPGHPPPPHPGYPATPYPPAAQYPPEPPRALPAGLWQAPEAPALAGTPSTTVPEPSGEAPAPGTGAAPEDPTTAETPRREAPPAAPAALPSGPAARDRTPLPARPANAREEHRDLLPKALANLAMRDLTLVEALLLMIQRLERREEDPKVLDILYRIDHLGARMRRNSENLLVMADEAVTPSQREPVPLYDVVRAAVSEITHYTRVRIQEVPRVLVRERAADDLSHLLAELMDNSIANSAEEFPVIVRGRHADDGTVLLEVADSGVGIPPEKLDRLNADLRDPPLLTPDRLQTMGLFVVGLLAHRHDLRVRLQARPFAGISSFVQIPTGLVAPDPDSQYGADVAPAPRRREPGPTAPRGTPVGARPTPEPPLPRRQPSHGGSRAAGGGRKSGEARGDAGHAFGRASKGEDAPPAGTGAVAGGAAGPSPTLPRRRPGETRRNVGATEGGTGTGEGSGGTATGAPVGDVLASPATGAGGEEPGSERAPALSAPIKDPRAYAERVRDDLSGFVAGKREHQQGKAARQRGDTAGSQPSDQPREVVAGTGDSDWGRPAPSGPEGTEPGEAPARDTARAAMTSDQTERPGGGRGTTTNAEEADAT